MNSDLDIVNYFYEIIQSLEVDNSKFVNCNSNNSVNDLIGFTTLNKDLSSTTFQNGPLLNSAVLLNGINKLPEEIISSIEPILEQLPITIDSTTITNFPKIVVAINNSDEFQGQKIFDSEINFNEIEITTIINILSGKDKLHLNSNLLELKNKLDTVYIHDRILVNISNFIIETKSAFSISAAKSLFKLSKGYALLEEREFVVPEDIISVLPYIGNKVEEKNKFVLNDLPTKLNIDD
jgi:MoxR-like ATPase